jgi:hypothetical protein
MIHDRRTMLRSLFSSSLLMPGMLSELLAADDPLSPRRPHTREKAKRVIFIYATGGVSHIETFDPKPIKKGRDGRGPDKLMGNIFGQAANPRCGTEVSDIFPHVRGVMDEICLIRSMNASHFDHSEATLGMHTGSPTFARPSMGSWVSYGLGTLNQNHRICRMAARRSSPATSSPRSIRAHVSFRETTPSPISARP